MNKMDKNGPDFPSIALKSRDTYPTVTEYTFSTEYLISKGNGA